MSRSIWAWPPVMTLRAVGMALDLGVEVVDQGVEVGLQQRGGGDDPLGVGVGPADVGLELAITVEESIRVHVAPPTCHKSIKKPTLRRQAVAWAFETRPDARS